MLFTYHYAPIMSAILAGIANQYRRHARAGNIDQTSFRNPRSYRMRLFAGALHLISPTAATIIAHLSPLLDNRDHRPLR